MSTLVTRAGKGSPLTHNEVDANFNNLNTDKIQSGNTVAALTITSASVVDLAVTGITSFDGSQGTAGQVLTSAGAGSTPTWTTVSSGSGTVTSVAATVPSILSVSGSPITTSGTLAFTYSGTALPVANGGTGLTSTPANGALDIGNGTGFTRTTLTAGSGVSVTNGAGSITIASSPAAGSIVKVLQTIKTDTFTTTSGSLTDITGMSVTITPSSASNKILVQYSLGQVTPNSPAVYGVALLRGSTVIGAGATAGSRISVSTSGIFDGDRGGASAYNFLDSPATTSATTYKLQVYINGGNTVCINRSAADADSTTYCRSASTITVMEVVG